jgi:predicted nucleic acid-binding protein
MPAGLHLDTNILIFGVDPAHPVHARLRQWRDAGRPVAVSAMAWAEFRCGPLTPAVLESWTELLADRILSVDPVIAERAADLFNLTGRRTRSLPDCLIAATAMRHGARLATLNRTDFEPLTAHGLLLA